MNIGKTMGNHDSETLVFETRLRLPHKTSLHVYVGFFPFNLNKYYKMRNK